MMTWKPLIWIALSMILIAQLACIPQDCMGVTFRVKGFVVDANGDRIPGAEVRAYGDNSYEKPGFDMTAKANWRGCFETDSVFRYGCSDFSVDVIAPGGGFQSFKYYPPAGEGINELPDMVTLQLVTVDRIVEYENEESDRSLQLR